MNRSFGRPKRSSGKGKKPSMKGLPPFVSKLFTIVEDPSIDHIISWGPTQDSFVVHKPEDLANEVLPLYFKHNNYCSFIRQVNTYGFTKATPDNWEFKNDFFKKGQPELLSQIVRRTSVKRIMDENPKEEKKSKSKIKEGDISMQVEQLAKANHSLQKELDKLKEERDAHEQIVTYFMDELKHSKDKQKEMIERERMLMGLLQKLIANQGSENEEIRKKITSLRRPETGDTTVPEELLHPMVGVKIENGSGHASQVQGSVAQPVQRPPEVPRSPQFSDVVPSSPLWNSWPTDFFGAVLEGHDPYLQQVVENMDARQALDAELDADLASMVDDLSFDSNFHPSHLHENGDTTTTPSKRHTRTHHVGHSVPFLFAPMQMSQESMHEQPIAQTQPSQHQQNQATPLPSYRFQPQPIYNPINDFTSLHLPPSSPLRTTAQFTTPPPSPQITSLSPFQVKEETTPSVPASPLCGLTVSPLSSIPGSPLSGVPASPLSGSVPSSPLHSILSPLPSSPSSSDNSHPFGELDASFVLNHPNSCPVNTADDCRNIEELAGQLQLMTSG